MIGTRLKLARAAAGLSLRALEERLEGLVTAQAIGKYERDEMMPSSAVLMALARELGVTEDHLLNAADVELLAVEFRKQKLISVKEDATARARILSEVERYLEVERILHLDEDSSAFPEKVKVSSFDEVETAAVRLRKHWKLGDDPIPNLCEVLEEKGIKICAIPLPAKVSGVQALVKQSDGSTIPVIVVNAEHAGERQRFTLAHELGHLCLDSKGLDIEQACHRFAGALLMPPKMVRKEIGNTRRSITPRELFALKQVFGVSAQAIVYRCRALGIISEGAAKSLFKFFSAQGWRKKEPMELRRERPARFERLTIRALAEGLISESKASELLQKTVTDVVESMDEPPTDDATGS